MDVSREKRNVWSGSLQKYLPNASVSASASKGQDYWQASGSARGALAIHGGGVTLGPYLGDTFALVEAKGASGAKVMNGMGAEIDSHGYALVPSLTPYRYNTVAINPEGMNEKTELDNGQLRVAPYAGAAKLASATQFWSRPCAATAKPCPWVPTYWTTATAS